MAFLRSPARLLGSVSLLLLAMLGFVLQVAERRVNHDLDEYANCVWLALVSMTGIGYGELFPQTLLGRAAASFAFFWGALLAALVVMTVLRVGELSESERRVHNMIRHEGVQWASDP